MDGFGRAERQQSSRPLPSMTQWGTTQPFEYPTYMGPYAPQPWNEPIYSGDNSTGARPQQAHTSGGAFQPGFDNSQPPSSRFLLQQPITGSSYQFPLDVNNDPMVGLQTQSLTTAQEEAAKSKKGKRQLYSQGEWDRQLPRIKKMYMDDDLTLRKTMARMAAEHDFHPSERAYKAKIEDQGWRKNLPLPVAQFIVQKQHERQDMPTDFVLYDNPISLEKAEETVRRSKASRTTWLANEPLETPTGLKYNTPPGHDASAATPNLSNLLARQQWTPFPDPHTPFQNYLPLVWQGKRVEDITALSREASNLEQSGDMELAERKYREALSGYERLLSPTHNDTLHLGYQLAGFYAKQNRMLQADEVLDWMNRKIVGQWGLSHQKSNAHFIHVSHLYRTWAREEDANILMLRLSEALNRQNSTNSSFSTLQSPSLPPLQTMLIEGQSAPPADTTSSDEVSISQQLKCIEAQLVDTPSIISPLEIKASLLDLIERCKKGSPKFNMQMLKAASVAAQLAQAMHNGEAEALQMSATETCLTAMESMENTDQKTLRAAIDVAHHLLEVSVDLPTLNVERILERVSAQAEENFQFESEKNIAILIRIACLYGGSNENWHNAKLWLEHAMSASMSRYCCHHPFVGILQASLEAKIVPDFDTIAKELRIPDKCLLYEG
ncbi:hypothetical protein CC80DRAFT_596144 [Byssothecium circinans]|uniref:Clr5 domain-containing protein n=1 Tax=Byssothecium circinans TaxID=147558 RepID=A0A6A5TLC3_9PLEO|nr:hypothetical protein CC80DRAFT_596144 [Byssothecium circinans]